MKSLHEMFCAIWYHFQNLKNVKVLKVKVTLFHECFSLFLNCGNGTKSCKTPHAFYLVLSFLCRINPFLLSSCYKKCTWPFWDIMHYRVNFLFYKHMGSFIRLKKFHCWLWISKYWLAELVKSLHKGQFPLKENISWKSK